VQKILNKCWEKELYIYPVPIKETYYQGKRQVQKCKIAIKTGNKEIIGERIYRQDEELYNEINKLYSYYANKIWGSFF
jgi:hypothetical protein